MENYNDIPVAQVESIYPDKVEIIVFNLKEFSQGLNLKVGSYLHISDSEDNTLIAATDSIISSNTDFGGTNIHCFKIVGHPLGSLIGGRFERGTSGITVPIKEVRLAGQSEIKEIFENSVSDKLRFDMCHLASDDEICVPLDGNKLFGKHIAVVGSTGSGKSYTVTKILQTVCQSGNFLNNSHIVIFDIHSEYHAAFPDANYLSISDLCLPYWLMNSTELQEFFLDTDGNDYNQRNIFKEGVINSKIAFFSGTAETLEKLTLDTPVYFEIEDVLAYASDKNSETVIGTSGRDKQGPMYGKLSNFISRLENKINDKRLEFLIGETARNKSFDDVLHQLMGYNDNKSNITIIDVSGVPFEVLSVTVSLISRILFDYGYFYKRTRANAGEIIQNDIPFLLVYEEAHKYVPNSTTSKYRAARESIERIAKEGRKYGVSLMLSSQRPSEISETVFSQCNNFFAMRLTNPNDQNYVRRLLPDSMGTVVDSLPVLRSGEALIVGESVVMPCIAKIDITNNPPSSDDIPYWEIWKEPWHDLDIDIIRKEWMSR